MKKSSVSAAWAVAMACGLTAVWAEDRIEQKSGKNLSGDITGTNSLEVKLKTRDGEVKVPANEIELIRYDQEPPELNLVRRAVLSGQYENALRDLAEKMPKAELKGNRIPLMQADIAFYTAYSTAKLAYSGVKSADDAEKLLDKFIKDSKDNYHFLEACEVLGDLRASNGKFAEAEEAYDKLSQSPIESVKLRGTVAKGLVLLKQGKTAEATSAFESVAALPLKEGDDYQQKQVRSAKLGKAACLAAAGKPEEGIKIAEEIIDQAPDDAELFARAYNTLGACCIAAKKPKEAALAYLHVDVLYANQSTEHAEALYHLVRLWKELKKDQESADAEALLKQRYATTTWAKQGK